MDQSIQSYIATFRVKELQLVLQRLGLDQYGIKAHLIQRIKDHLEHPFKGTLPSEAEASRARIIARALPQIHRFRKDVIRQVYEDFTGYQVPRGHNNHANLGAQRNYQQQAVLGSSGTHGNGAVRQGGNQATNPYHPASQAGSRKRSAPGFSPMQGDSFGQSRQQGAVAGKATQNSNLKCHCGLKSFRDVKELVVCKVCKASGNPKRQHTLQHAACMGYDLNKSNDGAKTAHMCENCRVEQADPFWCPVSPECWLSRLKFLSRLPGSASSANSTPLHQAVNVSIPKHIQEERRRNSSMQLQAVCIDITDTYVCQHRFHWPDSTQIFVNNRPARVISRNHKLGVNARDSPTDLTPWIQRDSQSLQVSVKAAGAERAFLFGIRAVVPRPVEAVLRLLGEPEEPAAAVERIKRLVGGGNGQGDDSDDDIIMGDTLSVSLRDPLSNRRVRRAARIHHGTSLQPFDLDCFLESAQKSRKWQCPVSMKTTLVSQVQPDVYMNAVLFALADKPSVVSIDVDKDGRWRASDHDAWHNILESPPQAFELPPFQPLSATAAQSSFSTDTLPGQMPERKQPCVELAQTWKQSNCDAQSRPSKTEVIEIIDSDDEEEAQLAGECAQPAAIPFPRGAEPNCARNSNAAVSRDVRAAPIPPVAFASALPTSCTRPAAAPPPAPLPHSNFNNLLSNITTMPVHPPLQTTYANSSYEKSLPSQLSAPAGAICPPDADRRDIHGRSIYQRLP